MLEAQLAILIDDVKREADNLAAQPLYDDKPDPLLIARVQSLLNRVVVTLEQVQAYRQKHSRATGDN